MTLSGAANHFKCRWNEAVTSGSITKRKVAEMAALITAMYVSSVMTYMGTNFWLWSFTKGIKRSYASMLFPSMLWVAMSALLVLSLSLVHRIRHGHFENYFFWVTREGVTLLLLIGLFDSLTGLTGMYATIHVPQILQTALISTGPIWTFLLARLLYPSSQPRITPHLIVVVVLIAAGVVLAVIPQVLESSSEHQYFSPGWIAVFLAATILFPLYNVLQGRFLHHFRYCCSPFTRTMIMLLGEVSVQLVLVVVYFPMDFAPLFGPSSSAADAWHNLLLSAHCVGVCEHNAVYMMIYVCGFLMKHVVFARLNERSPSVTAVSSMLTQPINAFFLLAIPSWNVFGAKKDWRYTMGCFVCLLLAKIIFAVWSIIYRTTSGACHGDSASSAPIASTEASKEGDVADVVGVSAFGWHGEESTCQQQRNELDMPRPSEMRTTRDARTA